MPVWALVHKNECFFPNLTVVYLVMNQLIMNKVIRIINNETNPKVNLTLREGNIATSPSLSTVP